MLLVVSLALVVAACSNGDPPASADASDAGLFCEQARGLKEDGLTLAGEEARRSAAERFTSMAKVAPREMRGDVDVLRAWAVDADEHDVVIVIGGPDAAESIRPYAEFMARHPKVPESGKRFYAYVHEACGFYF